MPEKKITRKVISRGKSLLISKTPLKEEVLEKDQVAVEEEPARERTKRVCFYCQKKSTPSYTDLVNLRRFLTDRAKILPKQRSGVCSKHQRAVAKNIKYARHLALLPFVPKV